ncbi:hypothetical protein VA249_45370 (plasmid) [Vibrio alfacsensis]|uniref:hypothetical protein n=1 Tax=Vibrio alfacsensis TaxID=1074311 RepID=UPI001BEFCB91|nr:hypothetical protein [Vibrio alfacsensis]BBM67891.1 hypothetical protein VA249_45370 [Vibrio alfacsensis]
MFDFGETYLAVHRLIDSVWTLKFKFLPTGVEVLSYSRDNIDGYEQERELPKIRVIEDDKRIVHAVDIYQLDGVKFGQFDNSKRIGRYKVLNPKFVFSYKQPEDEA